MPIKTKNDAGYVDYSTSNVSTNIDTPKSSFNPNFISESEAIAYAARRGFDDSFRGIKQIYGNITNNEELLEALKEKDEKLNAILENQDYGGKALMAYMGGLVTDPVGFIPFFGWAKKAKNMNKALGYGMSRGQAVRRGAGVGAAYSTLGYVGEDESRGENFLIGAGFGGTLAYGASKVGSIYNKYKKKDPMLPSAKEKQEMAGRDLVQDAKEGRLLSPDDTKKAQEEIIKELRKRTESPLSKSISGYNLRKNYEDIIGEKSWNFLVQNWGSSLAGLAAASGGYSALDDPDATELEKFGAAIALGLGGVLGVKGLKRIPTGNSTLGELVSRGLVDNYGLSEDYVKLKKGTLSEVNSLRSQFLDIVKATDAGLTEEEQKVFYAMLHGVMDDVPELKPLKDSTRKLIRDTGKQLVDVGLLNPKVFRKNAETYLHRSYDSKMADKTAGPDFVRAARQFKIIGDELRPRGPKPLLLDRKNYLKKREDYLQQGFDSFDINNLPEEAIVYKSFTKKQYDKLSKLNKKRYVKVGTQEDGKLITEDTKKIRLKRDFTKEERTTMGEIENASFAIAETGRLMTNDLSAYKLFENISKSEFAYDPVTFARKVDDGELIEDAFVKVPNTRRFEGKSHQVYEYGKLYNHYVPKEIYNDISKLIPTTKDEFSQLIGQKYLGAMRFWKKSKTAWNPTVHVNNTMSNVMMFDHADGQYKFLREGYNELKKGIDQRKDAILFRMAREDGVLDSDIVSRELNKETMGALGKAVQDLSTEGRDELTNSINYSKKLVSGSRKLYNSTFRKMEDWYQAEDQVFRMALYMDRLSKGYSRADAAADAKKWFIDYDINAPLINYLKNSATPFISYSYRVVPLLAETAARRPWKFAKWASLGYILNEVGKAYGVGDEEAERKLMPERYRERMFGVPFMPRTAIKTPFSSGRDKDVPLYIDTTRFIPGGDVFQMGEKGIPLPIPVPFSKQITGDTKTLAAPGALQPNFGIAGEVLAPLLFGIDPFTHEKLKELGLGNDSMVKFNHVLSRLLPNVPAPYILPEKFESFSSKRIREAFEGKTSRYGADFTPFEAVMSSFGFKLTPVDFEKLLGIESAEFRNRYDAVRRRVYKLQQEYLENQTPEKKEEVEEKINELYETLKISARKAKEANAVAREARQGKRFGGEVIDSEFPVSDVKENPSERENPFTGEPYLREQKAYGGELDVFTPLARQVEELASMQSVEGASQLSGGVMPMEDIQRESKYMGGNVGTSDIFKMGAKALGITDEQISNNYNEAARIVNKAADKGLIGDSERVVIDEEGKYNFDEVGDAFNAVNHAVLSYTVGDSRIRRAALQGKELLQGFDSPAESEIDRLNNSAGFDIRNSAETPEQREELIYKKISERTRKLNNGIPLERGKDMFFTFEEAFGEI